MADLAQLLTVGLDQFADNLDRVFKTYQTLAPALGAFAASVFAATASLRTFSAGAAGSSAGSSPGAMPGLDRLTESLDQLAASMEASGSKNQGGGGQEGSGATTYVVGGLAALFGDLGGKVSMVTDALQGVAGQVSKFVSALAPSTLELFSQKLQNLIATIGIALEPIIQVLAQVATEVGAILRPLMEQLRPVIQKIAQVLGDVFVTVVQAVAEVLEACLPLFELLAELLAGLAEILKPLIQVFSNIIKSFIQMIAGPDIQGALRGFREACVEVGRQLYVFAARMAVAFRAFDFLDNLISTLERRQNPGSGAVAAVQNVSTQGFEAIARQLQEAAAAASGAAAEGRPDATLNDLLDQLRSIRQQQPQGFYTWVREIRDFLATMAHAATQTGGVLSWIWDIGAAATNPSAVMTSQINANLQNALNAHP